MSAGRGLLALCSCTTNPLTTLPARPWLLLSSSGARLFGSTRDAKPNPSGEQEGNMRFPQSASRMGRQGQADYMMSDGETLESHQLHQAAKNDVQAGGAEDPYAGFAPVTKGRLQEAGREKPMYTQPWRDPNDSEDSQKAAEKSEFGEVSKDAKEAMHSAKGAVSDVVDSAKSMMPDVGGTVAAGANWVKDRVKQATETVTHAAGNSGMRDSDDKKA